MNNQAANTMSIATQMQSLMARLFPIHRAITGNGVRETLAVLQEFIPVELHEVPSGTQVLDWEVPQEWNIRDAFIKDARGRRIVDYANSNLHVTNCSLPVRRSMSWRELREHVDTSPEHPRWIPYRTAYFRDTWGFCISHDQYVELEQKLDEIYDVCIDSTLEQGSLTYGELILPGESDAEVLISSHVCHPSLANDNLSGIAVATYLARTLMQRDLRYTYRFLFAPATIGAITWLAVNRDMTTKIEHGLVLSLLGDRGSSTYKQSRRGGAEIDRVVAHVLEHSGSAFEIRQFDPLGYDERQFCSPGFDLPVGCLMRTPSGEFPQYHTSADDLDFISTESLADSWSKCVQVVDVLENNRSYMNLNPFGEPQLGRRGLYRAYGERQDRPLLQRAVMWVLNLSDGNHTLLDIAERASMSFALIQSATEMLLDHGLLAPSPRIKECSNAHTVSQNLRISSNPRQAHTKIVELL